MTKGSPSYLNNQIRIELKLFIVCNTRGVLLRKLLHHVALFKKKAN